MSNPLDGITRLRYSQIPMAGFVPDIPDWFKTRKAAQVAAFFVVKAGGSINILKLVKLIYLGDREHMDRHEHPITNDTYFSMPFGPVNSATYSYMNSVAPVRQGEWSEFIGVRNGRDIPLSQQVGIDDLDELNRAEVATLEATWETFKEIDRFDLAEWTHKYCPEWRNPRGSSIPIDYASIFSKLGKNDPVGLAEELQGERAMFAEMFAH